MTEFVLTNAQIRYGGVDVSGILNQVALEANKNLPEDSVFGDTTVNRVSGTRDGSVTVNGWWDDSADLTIFTDHVGPATEVISIAPENAVEGTEAYSLQAEQASYVPGAAHGEIFGFSFELQGRNALINGRLLGVGSKIASGNGAAYQLGQVPAGSRIFAALHVTAFGGVTPTLDVVLESDDNPNFTSAVTRVTFTQVTTTLQAQFLSAAGAITDAFWRLRWTIGGTGPSYNIFGVVGITAG